MNHGPRTVYRVGISGSYGGLNLGDEAILQVIVNQLRRVLPVEITVFSRNPEDTRARHQVERAVPVRDLTRNEARAEIERLDLLILGGGGILFDAEAHIYLREVGLAQERGIPVLVYAIGAGPLRDPHVQSAVRSCLTQATAVTVRERRARRVLEEIGIHRDITLTADPALLLEPEPLPDDALRREGLEGRRRLIGVSVREPGKAAPDLDQSRYHGLLANAADYLVDRFDADLVFVPMERAMLDPQHSHAVIAQMANARRATVLKAEYTSRQMLSLVGHFDFVVGMRLHFLIFAAIQRVPFVALPYAGKVTGFLEDLKFDVLPVDEVNAGRLLAHIDRSWDLRADLRERIDRNLPGLQERARDTNRVAIEILTGDQKADPTRAVA